MDILIMDGVAYNGLHVENITRKFSVLDGDNAGRVMSGEMVRDIIGTYYNYTLKIDPEQSTPAVYDAFYEAISAPVDSHTLKLPYAQGYIEFTAYVANGEDSLAGVFGSYNAWSELAVDFIATAPKRVPA